MNIDENETELRARITALEKDNAALRGGPIAKATGDTVKVPDAVRPLFDAAQTAVAEYFSHLKMDPTQGTIEIADQRYVLVRASALSKDFLATIQSLYADRGPAEAMAIGKNFLFDISHVIGINDARAFHQNMGFTDPVAKLSAGPVHFAYAGWAFVEILPESNPTPDDDFYLFYNHPYSFEADTWMRSGTRADTPVCIMNAGYSSGWCEESFGIPLTAVEVTCRAKGDEHCTFIMSPPGRVGEHLQRFEQSHSASSSAKEPHSIPTFFERKRVEEEMQRARALAEESAKTKSDFVANMSHELRTPLGAILGFTDLLKKTDLTAVQQDYLDAIHTSGKALLSIINDILDLSKLDAGKAAIEQIPFSVPELMHSLEVMFAAKAADKGLLFSCASDPAIRTPLLGDPMRLTQILTNLIGNAIKFTEKGSVHAHCAVERQENGVFHLSFTVRDTGIGIPEGKLAHVFERFTQADTDITRKYGGTGLGLAITKQLVELQGGTITLENGTVEGVVFCVRLSYPVAAAFATPVIDPGAMTLRSAGTKSILIVEDNPMNQKLTEIILHNNGFKTVLAENGALAVDVLRQQSFDLILMDIQMPVMDGYRATCTIRDDLHLATPIIAMTAHALDGERDSCIHGGMNDYIAKPFSEADLLRKMDYWLQQAGIGQSVPGPVVDLQFLQQQTRGNRTFIREMVGMFKTHSPGEVQALREAVASVDFDAVYKLAHRLRNSVGLFGLNATVGSWLQQIEQLARGRKGIDEIGLLLQKVESVIGQAIEELSTPDLVL